MAHGNPIDDDQVPRRRRQRQPRDARGGRHGQRDLPLLDLGNQHAPRRTPTPATPAATEVGVKFKTDTYGIVTGIRFYKASTNTGTHVGNLWTATGQLLATATFTGETALRLAAGELRAAGGAEHRTPPTSRPTSRPRATTRRTTSTSTPRRRSANPRHRQRRQPAAARAAEHQRRPATGSSRYSGSSTFPTSTADGDELLGRPGLTPQRSRAARPGDQRHRDRWLRLGQRQLDRPDDGGPVTTYTITPYIGSTAADADHGHREPGADHCRR